MNLLNLKEKPRSPLIALETYMRKKLCSHLGT